MTRDDVINTLSIAIYAYIRYADALDRVQRLSSAAECRTISYGESGIGSSRNGTEKRLVDLCEHDRIMREHKRNVYECKDRVFKMISRVSGRRHRLVLTCRYINGWGYRRTAQFLGCSGTTAMRLHNEAVAELCRKED